MSRVKIFLKKHAFKGVPFCVGVLTTLFLLVMFLIPLCLVVSSSIGDPVYKNYLAITSSDSNLLIIYRTARLGLIVAILCAILGYPAAYALTRLSEKWRLVAIASIVLPFLTSFLVRTYGWIAILGNSGPIVALFKLFGVNMSSLNGTLPGLVIAMIHMLLPLMIMPLYSAMLSIDGRQLVAASSMGARPLEAFFRVYFPQTLSPLLSATVFVFVLALGFFITPALVGGMKETTISQLIYVYMNQLYDWGRSSSLAIILLSFVLILCAIASRFVSLAKLFGIKAAVIAARKASKERRLSATSTWVSALAKTMAKVPGQTQGFKVVKAILLFDLLILVGPLLYVIAVSFQPLRLLAIPTDTVSLVWYKLVFNKSEWFDALLNSLMVAVLSTLVALVIGFYLALKAQRSYGWVRGVVLFCSMAPLAFPQIVLAVGIYGVFVKLGWIGNMYALALGHAIMALPYVFVNLSNGLSVYDQRLDHAASSLGARPFTAFRRVKIAVLKSSLIVASGLALLTSFDELIVTLFVAGPGLPTLPVRMWAASSQGISPELAVVGTLIIITVVGATLAVKLITGGRRSRAISASSPKPVAQEASV